MRNKKNRKKRSKEYVRVDVLRGLEEQRIKNELMNGNELNGDGYGGEGMRREEVVGFYYDMERKRYFPNEMKRERKEESELLVWDGLNVLEVILKMREGKNETGMKELLNRVCFEKRMWKGVDPVCEGSIHGVYVNDEWIWLGYHGCIVGYNMKNGSSEMLRECMRGELVCMNEGICVLNNGNESGVYDLTNSKESMYREEVRSGCHYKWNDKECMMICGRVLYIEMEDERIVVEYPYGYVCNCITKCCICGFRNGKIMEWKRNEWYEISRMRGCVKRLVYESDCVCGCDVFGNGVICIREGENWNSIELVFHDIEDICILNDCIVYLNKNGRMICSTMMGRVLKEERMEMRGKWICSRKNVCVIVNEKGNMMWSD